MTRYNWIALVLICSLGTAWAINVELGTKDLVQPDGTRFSVREYMDEYGHYLVAERGFVVQDATTGYYYYARYDSTGHATPSTLRVGRDDASSDVAQLAFENHQTLSKMARRLRGGGAIGAAGTRSATSRPESLLVILVEFSDVKHQNNEDWPIDGLAGRIKDLDGDPNTNDYHKYRVSHFEAMLFGGYTGTSPDGITVYGSMRQYWEDMSRRQYTLKGRVVNQVREDDTDIPIWVTLRREKSYYHGGAREGFRNAAMAAARQQGINTTTSATRKICIIYAGNVYYDLGGLHPLFYRLSVFPVMIPPLRARREDIPLLTTHFVHQYAQELQRPVPTLSDEVMAHLQGHTWPGNVRELAHRIERAVIVCKGGVLEVADVRSEEVEGEAVLPPASPPSVPLVEAGVGGNWGAREAAGAKAEKQQIEEALRATNGRIYGAHGAAQLLGMGPEKLRYYMRKYGVQRPKKS